MTLTIGPPGGGVLTGTVTGETIAASGFAPYETTASITFASDGTFAGEAEAPPGPDLTLSGVPGSCPPPPCSDWEGPTDEEFLGSMVHPYLPELADYMQLDNTFSPTHGGIHLSPIMPFDDDVVGDLTDLTVPSSDYELMPYQANVAGCIERIGFSQDSNTSVCTWRVGVSIRVNERFSVGYLFEPNPFTTDCSSEAAVQAAQEALVRQEIAVGDIVAPGDLLGWLVLGPAGAQYGQPMMHFDLNDTTQTEGPDDFVCPQPGFSCSTLVDINNLYSWPSNPPNSMCEGETLPTSCNHSDNDDVPDEEDNCPTVDNADQADGDEDGIGNACDNCPAAANAVQDDADEDGIGDACETTGGLRDYSGTYCASFSSGGQAPLVITQDEGDATVDIGAGFVVVSGTVSGSDIAVGGSSPFGELAIALTFAGDGAFSGDAEAPPGTPFATITGVPGECPIDPPPSGPCDEWVGPTDEEFLDSMVQPYLPGLAPHVRIGRVHSTQNPGGEFSPILPFDDSVVEAATGLTVPTEISGQAHPFELMPYRAASAGCISDVQVWRGMWEGECSWHVRVALRINDRFELNYSFGPGPEEWPLSCDDPLDALQQAQLDLVQVSPGDIVGAGDLLGWLITASTQQTLSWSTMMLNLNDNEASQETNQIVCPQEYYSCPALADFRNLSDAPWVTADTLCEGETLPIECGDSDSVPDAEDNCPTVNNVDQADGDEDGIGNACDNCPVAANADQADTDSDGIGDACETAGGLRDYSGTHCANFSDGGQAPLVVSQSEGDVTLDIAFGVVVVSGTVSGIEIAAGGNSPFGELAMLLTFAGDGTFSGAVDSPPGTPFMTMTGVPGQCPSDPPPSGPCDEWVGPTDEEFLDSMVQPYLPGLAPHVRIGRVHSTQNPGGEFSPILPFDDSVVEAATGLTVPTEISGQAHPFELMPYRAASAGCISDVQVWRGMWEGECSWHVRVALRINDRFELNYSFGPGPEEWPLSCDDPLDALQQAQLDLVQVSPGDIVGAGDLLGWLITASTQQTLSWSTMMLNLNDNEASQETNQIVCPQEYYSCPALADFRNLSDAPWVIADALCEGETLPIECGDSDSVPDEEDNCPTVDNADQADGDEDGVGNACDNCPAAANTDQADADSDTIGNACETTGGLRDYSGDYCVQQDIGDPFALAIAQSEGDVTLTSNGDVFTGSVSGNAIAATGTIVIGDISVAIVFASDGTFSGDAESPPGTPLTSLNGAPGECPPPDPDDPPPNGNPCSGWDSPSDEEFFDSMSHTYVTELASVMRMDHNFTTGGHVGVHFSPIDTQTYDDSVVGDLTDLTVPAEIDEVSHPYELLPYVSAAPGCIEGIHYFWDEFARGENEPEQCYWNVSVGVRVSDSFSLYYLFEPGPEEWPDDCDEMPVLMQQHQRALIEEEVEVGQIVAAGDVLGWLIVNSSQEDFEQSTLHFQLNQDQGPIICPEPYFACSTLVDFGNLDNPTWLENSMCDGEPMPSECPEP